MPPNSTWDTFPPAAMSHFTERLRVMAIWLASSISIAQKAVSTRTSREPSTWLPTPTAANRSERDAVVELAAAREIEQPAVATFCAGAHQTYYEPPALTRIECRR